MSADTPVPVSSVANGWINPIDANLSLTTVGLLPLLHRCQEGQASCMYVAKLVERQSDRWHEALVAADKALTDAYAYIEGEDNGGRDTNHVLVSIRVALAKVRSQLNHS